jgi:hypothetical protein
MKPSSTHGTPAKAVVFVEIAVFKSWVEIARRVLGSITSWVKRRNHAKNVTSSGQEGSGTNIVRQANDVRPRRPSEDTKVIEILLGPDFLEPGKARLRTVDVIFLRDGNTFNVSNGKSGRRVEV